MINKTTKNLIIFGATIVFSFVFINTTFAYSCMGYSCNDNTSYSNGMNNYGALSNQGYGPMANLNGYNPQLANNTNSQNSALSTTPTVVNNYYYPAPTAPKSTATTTTTTTPKTVASATPSGTRNTVTGNTNGSTGFNGNGVNGSTLGASAYNGTNGSDITALSLNGSGSFMPSSVWQWLLVIALILIIIIISRMFVHKASPADHAAHAAH